MAPLVDIVQGEVSFDGSGGLGEERPVGELDTAGWQGKLMRFEWIKVVNSKGLVRMMDAEED